MPLASPATHAAATHKLPVTATLKVLTVALLALLTTRAANGLFLLNPAQFALGNVPALAADGAQYTAFRHGLAETLEQLFLRFAWLQFNVCHSVHHPSVELDLSL